MNAQRLQNNAVNFLFSCYMFCFYYLAYSERNLLFNNSLTKKMTLSFVFDNFILEISEQLVVVSVIGMATSLLLITKKHRSVYYLINFVCFYLFFVGAPILREVHYSFIGFFMIFFGLGEVANFQGSSSKTKDLNLNKNYLFFIVSFTLTCSGISKFTSGYWGNGLATQAISESWIARPFVMEILSAHNFDHYQILDVVVLLIEISNVFFFISKKHRPIAWVLGLGLQLGIGLFLQLGQITLFYLIIYIYIFDFSWIRKSKFLEGHVGEL